MNICLNNLKPSYFEDSEIVNSEVYGIENLCFQEGYKYLISAHSGKGKSSLLNFIYGTNKKFIGEINFSSQISNPSKVKQLSYVFQDLKLFEEITVLQNIALKNELTQHKSAQEIKDYLLAFNLWHKKDVLLKKMSYGQRQRIAIIRALCQPFNFLLLDEPFSHLDNENIKIAWSIIKKEVALNNAGLIMISLGNNYGIAFDKVLSL